jgi:hypothetical protein
VIEGFGAFFLEQMFLGNTILVVSTAKKAINISKFLEERMDSIEGGVQSIGTMITSLVASNDMGSLGLQNIQISFALLDLFELLFKVLFI